MKWKQKRTREDHLGSEDPIHFTFQMSRTSTMSGGIRLNTFISELGSRAQLPTRMMNEFGLNSPSIQLHGCQISVRQWTLLTKDLVIHLVRLSVHSPRCLRYTGSEISSIEYISLGKASWCVHITSFSIQALDAHSLQRVAWVQTVGLLSYVARSCGLITSINVDVDTIIVTPAQQHFNHPF